MSILTEASLIITPSAYKEGSLLSVVPSNGNGDLIWYRNGGGTRTNKDGLIENVPYNLVTWSEQFENWSGFNPSTIISNYAISPTNTLSADLHINIYGNAGGRQSTVNISGDSVGTKYTISIFCKKSTNANTAQSLFLAYRFSGGSNALVETSSIIQVNDNWTRYNVTASVDYSDRTSLIVIFGNYNIASAPSPNSELLFWGAQITEGITLKDYLPTTTRLNIPRLDYSNDDCPSILVEPQRTNLALYSSKYQSFCFNSATSPTPLNDQGISLDGTLSAWLIPAEATGYCQSNYTIPADTNTYTWSIYVKALDPTATIFFNVNGIYTVSTTNATFTFSTETFSGASSETVKSVGNGWYRLTQKFTNNGSGTIFLFRVDSGINTNNKVLFWGTQLELGSYPTSYIPTVASTVTRVFDTGSKTGISDLLNPSEGTLFIESSALANDLTGRAIGIGDGTDFNYALIQYSSAGSNTIRFDTRNSAGVFRTVISVDDITLNKKILLTWKNNSIFAFINGVKYTLSLVAGSGDGIPTALNRIDFGLYWGGVFFYSKTKLVAVWKTQLTETQCTQLTTL